MSDISPTRKFEAEKSGSQSSPTNQFELTSYPIQIGNSEMKKWESSNRMENDHVPLVDDDMGPQFWLLERADEELLWSFHVQSGDEKLYLTYNDGDPKDHKVTMRFVSCDDSSKEKYFRAFVTVEGKILLVSRTSDERFLGIKDGILATVDANAVTSNMEWIIAVDIKKPSNEGFEQIMEYHQRLDKWISAESEEYDKIKVQASGRQKQLWKVTSVTPTTCTFQTPPEEGENFASQDPDSVADMIFIKKAKKELIEYEKTSVKGKSTDQFHLQNTSSKWFVGKQHKRSIFSTLEMKKEEDDGTIWTFGKANFVFIEKGGNHVIFPPISRK